MAFDQTQRIASVKTPFGEDQVALCGFTGSERLSAIPRFELELISEQQDLDPKKIIGQPVGVTLNTLKGGKRYFHGDAIRFGRTRQQGRYFRYHATIVPWLWFLTRTRNCRIFQHQKVPDIVEQVFKAHGFDQIELRLQANYTPWEYCVQYRESDFAFVSRLLEQEGIYYFFQYQQSKEMLVFMRFGFSASTLPGLRTDQVAPDQSGWGRGFRAYPGVYFRAQSSARQLRPYRLRFPETARRFAIATLDAGRLRPGEF